LKIPQKVREALLKRQKRINRPTFYYESGWVRSGYVPITEHITLGSAYSDTAVVTSGSRRSQYRSWIATNWIKFSLSLVPAILYLQH